MLFSGHLNVFFVFYTFPSLGLSIWDDRFVCKQVPILLWVSARMSVQADLLQIAVMSWFTSVAVLTVSALRVCVPSLELAPEGQKL